MHVRRRQDHSIKNLFKRTISAQLHAIGSVLMIGGAAYLLPIASQFGPQHFWACFWFIFTGTLVFTLSAVYHFLGDGYELSPRLEAALENLDHFGIYLFIAGTYTPFIMSALSPPWRIPLLITIWTVAVVGITYTWSKPLLPKILQHRMVYTSIFMLMGWTIIVRIHDVYTNLNRWEMFFLVAGGVAYSVGAVVYATRRPRLMEGFFGFHELWHVMVLLGAGFHYFLILSFYSIP